MKDGLIISLLSIIPKKPVAQFMGFSARLELPSFIQKLLIRYFVWKYDVNIEECQGSIDSFASLADFFIRPLREGRRIIDRNTENIVSPVDGRVHAFGRVEKGVFFQSDTQHGSVAELLGEPENSPKIQPYKNGHFITIYLSPQDYHRVHSHEDGVVEQIQYLAGALWPVFPVATQNIPHLFDRNERLVFHMQHPTYHSALAMIGAFGVGRMTTEFVKITTNTGGSSEKFSLSHTIARGEEVGRFELGSTVILVFPENISLDWKIDVGQKVQLGSVLCQKRTLS